MLEWLLLVYRMKKCGLRFFLVIVVIWFFILYQVEFSCIM